MSTWICASSQSTSSPSIQIFSVGVMGIRYCLSGAGRRAGQRRARGDRVADLGRGAGDVVGLVDGFPYSVGRGGLAEELEHHRRGDDRGPRVGLPLPGDVGRRAVHRLEHRRPGAGRVEVGRRGPADAAGDRAAEVGEDVAEEVVGDHDVVAAGVLHEVDAGGVDVVVGGGDVGVLGCDLVERALPEVAREGEDVGLVHQGEVLALARPGQVEGVADAPLDPHPRVDRALGRDLVGRALAEEPALARVGALGVLAHHDHVDAVVERGSDRR